ncbi:MAG TPA: decaprenyl-phosphate phosphoribosyltransferase [Acidobacteriota bacterium]|nr:decaprenyl-phosphate phosphoribosyltransferase [Acidobacteriota bacterium]
MNTVAALIRSLRPKQWIKNLILYAGWLFSLGERAFEWSNELALFGRATWAFAVFCLLSSSIYLFNDIMDVRADRLHPVKRKRPIASGALPIPLAACTSVVLLAAGLAAAFTINAGFAAAAVTYFVLVTLYSLALKRVPILDSMIIAFGFVLRAIAGALAVEVAISVWLVVCTIFLALFLGFAKRRSELVTLGDAAANHRDILALYSVGFLDLLITICCTLAVISYSLYSISSHAMSVFGPDALLTLPFVFFGVFRYLYLVVLENRGEDPATLLLHDYQLLGAVILWIAVSTILLTLKPGLLNNVLVQ